MPDVIHLIGLQTIYGGQALPVPSGYLRSDVPYTTKCNPGVWVDDMGCWGGLRLRLDEYAPTDREVVTDSESNVTCALCIEEREIRRQGLQNIYDALVKLESRQTRQRESGTYYDCPRCGFVGCSGTRNPDLCATDLDAERDIQFTPRDIYLG